MRGQDITSVKAGVNLAKAKKDPWGKMVTHPYPLEEAVAAIQLVARVEDINNRIASLTP